MKKFTEPSMEIIYLEPVDILLSSSELIGWAGFDQPDSQQSDFDFPNQ